MSHSAWPQGAYPMMMPPFPMAPPGAIVLTMWFCGKMDKDDGQDSSSWFFWNLVLIRDFMQFVQRFIFYSFHSVLLGSQVRTRRAWRSIPLGCKHLLIHIQGWFACLGGVFNNLLHLDFSSDLRRFWQPFSDGLKPTTTPREDFHIPSRKNTQNLKMLNYHRVDIGSVIVVLTWLQDSLFDWRKPRQATMVASMATAEGDLGLGMMPGMPGMAPMPGMPGMGLNPWVLPDAPWPENLVQWKTWLKNERFDCLRPVGMDKKVVIKTGHHLDLLEKRGFLNMFPSLCHDMF